MAGYYSLTFIIIIIYLFIYLFIYFIFYFLFLFIYFHFIIYLFIYLFTYLFIYFLVAWRFTQTKYDANFCLCNNNVIMCLNDSHKMSSLIFPDKKINVISTLQNLILKLKY